MQKETGKWKDRWRIWDLLADRRCSRAVLDFLSSTDVGRRAPAEEDTVRGAGRRGELPLVLATPDFMASAGED